MNSILKKIYKLEPKCHIGEFNGEYCEAVINYKGKTYCGDAFCHVEDKEYFSEKVGFNIATQRALLKILKHERDEAKKIYDAFYVAYQEATVWSGNEAAEVDPTGAFWRRVEKAHASYEEFATAVRKENAALNHYINNVNDMMQKMKKIRSEGKTE